SLLVVFLLYNCSNQNNETVEISENWTFKNNVDSLWFEASVPGDVHMDLLKNGLIEDPFYRLNEHDLQWIDKTDWEYKTEFDLSKKDINSHSLSLDFHGIDTYSSIYLNDSLIATTDNMFIGKTIDIKNFAKLGKNKLYVKLYSPINKGVQLHDSLGYDISSFNANDLAEIGKVEGNKRVSVFTRKAPYHYGWDWGPRLVTSGIWQPINIKKWNYFNIEDLYIRQENLNESASLVAEIEVESYLEIDEMISEIYVDNQKVSTDLIYINKGANKIEIPFTIKDYELWWPNGMGDQNMYEIKVKLQSNNNFVTTSKKIGLREINLVTSEDSIGNNFYFEVNKKPVFMKGVNYIPQDVFLNRVSDDKYEELLNSAVDANMNMIRVWGGGIYENEIFYNLCDEKGLLVWQDFMFACAMYPGDKEFLKSVEQEAEFNVKRLRGHPSIALWCGNNEVRSAWKNWGWEKDVIENQSPEIANEISKAYDDVFHKILPKIVNNLDSSTAYWPSSPGSNFSGGTESYTSGDAHYWGVWWGKENFESYNQKVPRFMSEFGFQSFPEFSSIDKYTNESDYSIYSDVMKSHQRSSIGNKTVEDYMLRYYKKPKSFKGYLYVSQILQAYGVSMGMEAHRRNKGYSMGSLYWQLNDCWPVASWSSIDYFGKWKALHYSTKKAFQPVLISFFKSDSKIELHIISDLLESKDVDLNLKVLSFSGEVLYETNKNYSLQQNSTMKVESLSIDWLNKNFDSKSSLLVASLFSKEIEISNNIYYLSEFKDIKLTKPLIEYEINELINTFEVSLTSKNLVKNVFVDIASTQNFSDNYFDMIPGKDYKISINKDESLTLDDIKRKINFLSLFDTY
ncbi:MAG: glycoside hydrolase family 2 protein, partial [Flavobacteriaceae bacterium]|nr:glycoside hydrolase family 2 protein [Flavobacteriaceae bacterium]